MQWDRQAEARSTIVPERFPLLVFPLGAMPILTGGESAQEKFAIYGTLQYFEKH